MTSSMLARQLADLAPEWRERLDRHGFRADQLLGWAASLGADPAVRNRLAGRLEEVPSGVIRRLESRSDLESLGQAALQEGRVAICVLAGGMATRMGGVIKALVEAVPGKTFLDLRLDEVRALAGRGARVPLWLMTSEPTEAPVAQALAQRDATGIAQPFRQFVSLRLETSGELFLVGGEPSVYATGHGDLPDALLRSGLLDAFLHRGGRYVWIANLDNVGATVDPLVLGHHIASGRPLTAEVVDRRPGDAGGGPVLLDGRPIITEHLRLPPEFDASRLTVFNTNSFIVDAEALRELRLDWTYLEVHKRVEDRTAVQFERLLGEMTSALDTHLLHVPRDGGASRFLPVKRFEDLAAVQELVRQRLVGGSPTPR